MTDFGDILMEFDAKNKKEKEFEELKQGVKTLKRRRDAMLERETKIREDLNSGVVGNSSNYRLPLAVLPAPNHSKSQVVKASVMPRVVTFLLTGTPIRPGHC